MEARRLIWRNDSLLKLEAHGIEQHEVLEVVRQDAWISYRHPDYPAQARIVGPTALGRLITVVLDPMQEADVWRPVTGWDASPEDREYYREQYP